MPVYLKGEEYVENLGATEKPQPHLVKKIIGRGVISSLWAVVFGSYLCSRTGIFTCGMSHSW